MKRLEVNTDQNNFIGCWKSPNHTLFDKMVNFFDENISLQKQGRVGGGINLDIKKTKDIAIDPINLQDKKYFIFNEYISELFQCYQDYKNQWPFLKKFKKVDIPSFNLQRYLAGDHFSAVHTERSSAPYMHRIFAWMTYLNDVEETANGCTHFTHYDLKIRPEKGKTIIWPAEWTHAHSAEMLNKDKKYIITGWICFAFD